MGKRFLLLFLLTLLVGSIFLFNYLVVKQTDKTAEHKAELASKEESNQIADRGDSTSEEDYGTVAYDTLFDNSVFHHFKIVMTKEEWKGLSDDMLAIAPVDENMRTGKYRKADLYYEDKNGQVKVGEVGIRTKGNLSRTLPEDSKGMNRFHFKIKFDETFQMSKETAGYAVRKDREFADLSSLNFKVNDGADPTNIREIFAYDLINSYGVTAPKASMATLTFVIEGVEHNFGVVRYIESVDKNFLTQRYGKKLNDGNLYKCLWQNYGPASLMPLSQTAEIGIKDSSKNYRPTYDRKTNENDIDYQDLQDFIENLNSRDSGDLKKYLDSNFSVDRFIKAQALDVVIGNIDGYWSMGNNYYLYFSEDGKIEWIPYDYEHVLGAGWSGDAYWSYEGIATADIYQWNNLNAKMYSKDVTHPLMDKLLQIDEYKATYEKYLKELIDPVNDYFTYDRFMKLYEELYQLYGSSVENEMHQGDVWKLSNEKWYFTTKIESVEQQLSLIK